MPAERGWKTDVSSQPDAGGNTIGARPWQPKAVGKPMLVLSPTRAETPSEHPNRTWLENQQRGKRQEHKRHRRKANNAQKGASMAAASPCAAASRALAAAEGEPDAVVVGDVEDVIAAVLVT